MQKLSKYFIGSLGVALVVGISVFPNSVALWLAFAIAIAVTAVASADAAVSSIRGQRLAAGASTAIAAGGAFLIVASLIFEGVSLGWLQAIAGATVTFVSLGVAALPQRRAALSVASAPAETRQAI